MEKDIKKTLSVIVPAYNEEDRLPSTVKDIISYLETLQTRFEIIIVDDGSTDGTGDVISEFENLHSEVRGITLKENCGKGCAVRTGALSARGNLILFTDADGSTPIAELERLLQELAYSEKIVIGSRAIKTDHTNVDTVWYRKAMGRIFNGCVNLFLIPEVTDTQCGFKLFPQRTAQFLFGLQESNGFSFDIELLFLAKKCGIEVTEVAVNWTNVPGSKVNLVFDSLKMFLDIFRYAIRHRAVTPRDYERFLDSYTPRASLEDT